LGIFSILAMPCEGFRFVNPCLDLIIYIIKKFVQPKMSFNNREREWEGSRERGAGGQVSRQAYLSFG
jgi:hypothetical protein